MDIVIIINFEIIVNYVSIVAWCIIRYIILYILVLFFPFYLQSEYYFFIYLFFFNVFGSDGYM